MNLKKIAEKFDVDIHLMPLHGARGAASKVNGKYIILIDDRLSKECQEKVLAHELLHIVLGHFDESKDLPEDAKERQVNSMLSIFGVNPRDKKEYG